MGLSQSLAALAKTLIALQFVQKRRVAFWIKTVESGSRGESTFAMALICELILPCEIISHQLM
jgi:hypothetical protein